MGSRADYGCPATDSSSSRGACGSHPAHHQQGVSTQPRGFPCRATQQRCLERHNHLLGGWPGHQMPQAGAHQMECTPQEDAVRRWVAEIGRCCWILGTYALLWHLRKTSSVALVVPDDGCVRCSKQLPACRLRQRALQIPALFGCPERRKGSIAWNTVKVPLMWGPPCKTASAAAPLTTLWLLWILSLLSSSLLSRGPHPRLYFQRSVNAFWGHQPVKALWGLH